MKSSFSAHRANPYRPYSQCYQRVVPLCIDTARWDHNSDLDFTHHAFKNSTEVVKYMHFTFNMLFENVPTGGYLTALFFNSLDNGASWQELAGEDICASNPPSTFYNQGLVLVKDHDVQPGEMVRAVPCFAWGDPYTMARLTNSVNGGVATCNYFSGFEQ